MYVCVLCLVMWRPSVTPLDTWAGINPHFGICSTTPPTALKSLGVRNSIFVVLFLKREVIFFMAHHSHKYEREYQRKRGLQREVLEHLKRYSPKKLDMLYSYFTKERGADI